MYRYYSRGWQFHEETEELSSKQRQNLWSGMLGCNFFCRGRSKQKVPEILRAELDEKKLLFASLKNAKLSQNVFAICV